MFEGWCVVGVGMTRKTDSAVVCAGAALGGVWRWGRLGLLLGVVLVLASACYTPEPDCIREIDGDRISHGYSTYKWTINRRSEALAVQLCRGFDGDLEVTSSVTLGALEWISGDLRLKGSPYIDKPQNIKVRMPALTQIGGNLNVTDFEDGDGNAALALGALEEVSGDVILNGVPLGTLELPLKRIGGDLKILGNPTLEGVSLPLLESVGGNIEVGRCIVCNDRLPLEAHNDVLSALQTPSLVEVGGDIEVASSPALQSLDLEALVSARGIGLEDLEGMLGLFLPALRSLGWMVVEGCGELTSIDVPSVVDLPGGALRSSVAAGWSLAVRENPRLNFVSMPQLTAVTDDTEFSGNPSLFFLEFGALESLGNLTIASNGLKTVSLPALETVEGRLGVELEPQLERLEVPSLRVAADGVVLQELEALESLQLERLEEAERVSIHALNSLVALSLPGLRVSRGISVSSCARLASLEVTGAFEIGSLSVQDAPLMALLEVESLTVTDWFGLIGVGALERQVMPGFGGGARVEIWANDALRELVWPQVSALGALSVSDNGSLERLEVDGLTDIAQELQVDLNPELERLSLGALVRCGGDVTITQNGALTDCDPERIRLQLDRGPDEVNISENLGDGLNTCEF